MKEEADNSNSSLISALIYSLTILNTLNKSYQNIINLSTNCNKILVAGLLDGLAQQSSKAPPLISTLFEELEEKIEDDNPNYLKKLYTNLYLNYNKQYKILKKIAENQDLEADILLFPTDFSGKDQTQDLLNAVEKIANKFFSKHTNLLNDLNLKVKAASNTIQGYLLSNIFIIGQYIGKNISKMLPLIEKDSKETTIKQIRDYFIIWEYISEITNKTLRIPSQASDIVLSSLIMITTGFIDSVINDNNQSKIPKINENEIKTLKDIISSNLSSFKETFLLQNKRLEQLNMSLNTEIIETELLSKSPELKSNKKIEEVLQDKPWISPDELLARKTLATKNNILPKLLRIADMMKSGVKTINGTIFSNCFKLGTLLGKNCLKKRNSSILNRTNHIKPNHTPNNKTHTNKYRN